MSNGKPRRRSIFGPVLLITLGTLFLLANLSPEIRVWRWLVDYWPLLLILWGLAKLFDYFAAQRAGDTRPRGMSGGEVFLLIVLVIVGLGITGTREFIIENPGVWEEIEVFGHPYSYTEELVQPAKPGQEISIQAVRGDIVVQPEDIAEIRVLVKKTARSMDESEAQRRAQGVKVAIQETPVGYEVRPQVDSDSQRGVRVDLEVHVPKQSAIRAKTERGDVRITGTTGPVTVDSQRGDIEIRHIAGEVNVEMRRGDVRVVGVTGMVRITGRGSEIEVADITDEAAIQGEFYGPIRVKNVAKEVHFLSQRTDMTISELPGRMEMGSGATEVYDTPGSVSITTREKDITFENVGGRIRVENRRGDVFVRLRQAAKQEIEIANDSGAVELSIPSNSSFEISASSRQGEIESDFDQPGLVKKEDERTSTLEGKVGDRGPKIQLRTSYGPIRLRKSD